MLDGASGIHIHSLHRVDVLPDQRHQAGELGLLAPREGASVHDGVDVHQAVELRHAVAVTDVSLDLSITDCNNKGTIKAIRVSNWDLNEFL